MDNRPIGIFDSGVGGLTVVDEMRKILPHESLIYLGDTARVPYGAKSRETILQYGREIIQFLISQDVKAVVIACGTVSSNAYDELTQSFDLPLIDVLRPGVRACLHANPARVGFIATEATVRSGVFAKLLTEHNPAVEVYAQACPLFVPLTEEGWTDNAVTQLVADIYLAELKEQAIDTIVLGCTHYPLLTGVIERVMGPVTIINMAEYTARAAKTLLTEQGLLNESGKAAEYTFYVSGYTDKFNKMAQMILKEPYTAQKVTLE